MENCVVIERLIDRNIQRALGAGLLSVLLFFTWLAVFGFLFNSTLTPRAIGRIAGWLLALLAINLGS